MRTRAIIRFPREGSYTDINLPGGEIDRCVHPFVPALTVDAPAPERPENRKPRIARAMIAITICRQYRARYSAELESRSEGARKAGAGTEP
jgi:hypothetical protein